MILQEGRYYRARGEQIVGPVRRRDGTTTYPWGDGVDCWTDSGRFSEDVENCDMDLISEVYVSDTPPAVQETEAEWRARLLAAGPGPLIKVHDPTTLRDKFAMAALQGLMADSQFKFIDFNDHAKGLYRIADAMMIARREGEKE